MVMRPTKATSNAARAAAVTSQMLRDYPVQQHREEAGGEEDEPKLDYLTAEDTKRAKQQGQTERAREKAAEATAERRPSPMSKAQLRKLAQIEAKKQKAAARKEVMAVLAAHRSDDLSFIKSSSTLGVTPTKRQRLQRALQARAASVVLDEEADAALEQPRQAREWEEAAPAPAAAVPPPPPRNEAASRAGKKGKAAAAGEKKVQEKKVVESEGQAGGREDPEQAQERDDAWWAKQAAGFSTAARVLQPGSNREDEATDAAPEAKGGKKWSHPSGQAGPADPSDDPLPPAFTTRFGPVEARAAAAAALLAAPEKAELAAAASATAATAANAVSNASLMAAAEAAGYARKSREPRKRGRGSEAEAAEAEAEAEDEGAAGGGASAAAEEELSPLAQAILGMLDPAEMAAAADGMVEADRERGASQGGTNLLQTAGQVRRKSGVEQLEFVSAATPAAAAAAASAASAASAAASAAAAAAAFALGVIAAASCAWTIALSFLAAKRRWYRST